MIIIKRILIFLIATISFLIIGCDDTVKPLHHSQQEKAELQKYIQRIKSDLIFVQGGTFWMGDFCKKNAQRWPLLFTGERYQATS